MPELAVHLTPFQRRAVGWAALASAILSFAFLLLIGGKTGDGILVSGEWRHWQAWVLPALIFPAMVLPLAYGTKRMTDAVAGGPVIRVAADGLFAAGIGHLPWSAIRDITASRRHLNVYIARDALVPTAGLRIGQLSLVAEDEWLYRCPARWWTETPEHVAAAARSHLEPPS